MTDLEYIGLMIRQRRTDAGWSQADLGRLAGVSRPSVANAEAGRQDLPVMTLAAAAKAFGCLVDDLLPPVRLAAEVPAERNPYTDRCPECTYLRTSPGHRAACGEAA
jgi:transcriptional regulator with XRE-family HTH domain